MYDRAFFDRHRDGARRSAAVVVPIVLDHLRQARSVLDVGCGRGTWLSVFRGHGLTDVHGVDGDYVDRQDLEIPANCFTAIDLVQPFALGRRFDLVVCLEVAEHLPAAAAETLVESLTTHGPVVLFSAAIPFQGGDGHVNEQWPDYWTARFNSRRYSAVDCLRARIWNDDHVDWWYAQNMLLFVDQARLHEYPALEQAAARQPSPPLNLVHPRKYLELIDWIESEQ
jgi:SAM-dependent methyltransferase